VILLDLAMPHKDGLALCRELRDICSADRVYIIEVTGYERTDDREKTRKAGFDAHLIKPLDPALLAATLQQVCGL
jgi:CheY-like chemotaxis protein